MSHSPTPTPPPPSDPTDAPDATVVISTLNRKEDLAICLESVLAQTASIEVLVIDDGSTDGTSEMVREKFPTVRVDRHEKPRGLIKERNRGAELATAPIIVSIDDDAIFPSTETIAQTVAEFRAHPRVGAVAIPYIDVKIEPDVVRQRSPEPGVAWVSEQYRGTAHALRRDLFLQLGQYRPQLWRQGEEQDYCIRLYDSGHVVLMGSADPIHHLESPKRSKPAIYTFTARNTLWYAWHNVPMPQLLWHAFASTAKLKLDAFTHPNRLLPRFKGIWQGWIGLPKQWKGRRAVSAKAYRLIRRLRKQGPMKLTEIEPLLPTMRQ